MQSYELLEITCVCKGLFLHLKKNLTKVYAYVFQIYFSNGIFVNFSCKVTQVKELRVKFRVNANMMTWLALVIVLVPVFSQDGKC